MRALGLLLLLAASSAFAQDCADCNPQIFNNENGFMVDQKFKPSKSAVCETGVIDVHKLCGSIGEYCKSKYKDIACRVFPGTRSDKSVEEATAHYVAKYASNQFFTITQDERFLKTCCLKDKDCREKFSSTRLTLIPNRSSNTVLARYNGFNSSVEIGLNYLIRCPNNECIEEVVNHELGHACQSARGASFIMSGVAEIITPLCNKVGRPLEDLQATVGKSVTACIVDRLKTVRGFEKRCDRSWYEEAFANVIFAREIKNSIQLAKPCVALADFEHGPLKSYLDCMIAGSPLASSVCGK